MCATSTDLAATSGDGHNADTRCTLCHAHTRDSQTNAFQAACDACHGNPPVDDNTLAGFVVPSRTGSVTAGAHSRHVTSLGIGCDACHANSAGSGASHANGDLTVSIGFSLFGGIYTGGSYSGQDTVSYNASSPSTTVSSNGLRECGNIYCHGSTMAPNGGTDITPVWDNPATVTCGSCHGSTSANAPRKGAHFRHTGPYTDVGHEYPCSSCHKDPSVDTSLHVNNRSEVNFSTHPTVSGASIPGHSVLDGYGTCSNVYCHSTVQTSPPGGAPTYKPINWGTSYGGDMGCSACHEGPMDHYSEPLNGNTSGSHSKHASSRIYCATCHANDVSQDPDPGVQGWACFTCHSSNGPNVTHANYTIDVNIVTKFGGMYTGTPTPGDAYGRCSSTYCHSSGVSVRTGSLSSSASVTWGSSSIVCNSCHGNTLYPEPNSAMPDYPNGTPKENSHAVHVSSNSVPCQNCHAGTTNDGLTIANASLHVNKSYDMKAGGTFGGKTISFTYSAATTSAPGSCGAISCHSGNTAQWGATLNCQDCHLGTADMDDFSGAFWNNGTAGVVSRGMDLNRTQRACGIGHSLRQSCRRLYGCFQWLPVLP
jgi:predicted CxxxxCH...CXXCH cytochrome family protein